MTQGERLVAEMMGDIPAYGYPVLIEQHPFLRKVTAFMKSKVEWNGTATELLWALRDVYTPPNTAAKLLRKYSLKLHEEHGIKTCFSRIGRKKSLPCEAIFPVNDGFMTVIQSEIQEPARS